MKTPLLLDVPKSGPTKKQKLEAFKKAFGIWTYRCSHMPKEYHPWEALLLPAAREYWKEPTMEPIEIIANYCRVLEEQGLLVSGESERKAIAKLCENRGIPFGG